MRVTHLEVVPSPFRPGDEVRFKVAVENNRSTVLAPGSVRVYIRVQVLGRPPGSPSVFDGGLWEVPLAFGAQTEIYPLIHPTPFSVPRNIESDLLIGASATAGNEEFGIESSWYFLRSARGSTVIFSPWPKPKIPRGKIVKGLGSL